MDFAVYVREDLKLDRVNVGKRVAATDACVQHGELGGALPANAGRIDLIAAQTLGVNVEKIPNGKATYGKSIEKVRSSALGGFAKASADLRADLRRISDFSKACGAKTGNTKINRTCRAAKESRSPEVCTLEIKGESSLNLAELSPAQIANVATFVVDIPKGTSLVTNLSRNSVAVFRGVEVKLSARCAESPGKTRIFWNFPAGDRLEFTSTRFRGTVVAPDAGVSVCGQKGDAGFWVRELNGTDSSW